MTRAAIYKEMMELFGIVPSMFKSLPDETLELEWQTFKKIQYEKGPIPNKLRELIGLAIAALQNCKFCIFYHTELAKLNGATKEEIEETIHFAKSSAGWCTYIAGMQLDFEKFKKEIRQACLHVKRKEAVLKSARKSAKNPH